METVTRIIGSIVTILISLLGLGWLGLQIKPRSFPLYAEANEDTPWLVLDIEDIAYNVDIAAYICARGL